MEQAGIQLNNGLEHGEEGRGFVRMNFAVTRATLDAALDRIEKIFWVNHFFRGIDVTTL